jgi:hypothetical protein
VSADPALVEGKYFPKPNDYDTEHDFYWYLQQDGSKKLPGIGGVFNAVNMDVYHYAGNNPVKLVDPDGEAALPFVIIGVFIKVVWDIVTTPRMAGDIVIDKNGKLSKVGDTDKRDASNLLLSTTIQASSKAIAKPIAEKLYSKLKAANAFRATSRGGEIYRIRQVENFWEIFGKPIEGSISQGSQKIVEKIFIKNSKEINNANKKDNKLF